MFPQLMCPTTVADGLFKTLVSICREAHRRTGCDRPVAAFSRQSWR